MRLANTKTQPSGTLSGEMSGFTVLFQAFQFSPSLYVPFFLWSLDVSLHHFLCYLTVHRCAALDGPNMEEQHPGGLSARVDEGGSNWSTGQRQLICLARAVLRAPKVLAIDEATANIDLETDAIVQQSIRSKFKVSTCLTIAHRLQTILDSDLIVTMDAGKVSEVIRNLHTIRLEAKALHMQSAVFVCHRLQPLQPVSRYTCLMFLSCVEILRLFVQAGSPAELLEDPNSLFSALVKNDKGASAKVGSKSSSENLAALA